MRIVFMGTPEFAVPSLRQLIADGHEIVCVLTQPDKPKNRGMKLMPSPVKVVAMEHQIEVYQPATLKSGEALERLSRQGWQGRCRLLPYQAVGVECGMLLALRLDGARVGTEDYGKLLLALSPTRLTDGGGYHALIGT